VVLPFIVGDNGWILDVTAAMMISSTPLLFISFSAINTVMYISKNCWKRWNTSRLSVDIYGPGTSVGLGTSMEWGHLQGGYIS